MAKDAITKELEQIALSRGGILRAEDVVEYARNPETVLHGEFTWDDTVAARQWRLHQAREIIRVRVVLIDQGPRAQQEVRAWVSLLPDRQKPGGGYRGIREVLGNEQMRALLLADAKAELLRVRAKYAALKELAGVWVEIDKLKDANLPATVAS